MEYNHFSVLFNDTLENLNIRDGKIYVDGTLGGSGHSLGILEKANIKKLICNDYDTAAIENAKNKLKKYLDKIIFINDDYKNLKMNLNINNIDKVDGILLDLGVSSYQIDTPERGFSYIHDAKLDMRMDTNQKFSAYEVVNEYSEKDLTEIFFKYGDERHAKRIAQEIVKQRSTNNIETTLELAELIKRCYPLKEASINGNPAKKVFQAIRIEVNHEIEGFEEFLYQAIDMLNSKGRMCVITFHSLEDRIVKHVFNKLSGNLGFQNKNNIVEIEPTVIKITKKPILGEKEENINKRSSSAKLRVIEKI
ncbi:MAG: 16S rRNA (cytosine(1402)-N(4))-methyltransferase RsmH [Clostridia bacterium]|nr:16S rRNA (cytosine(1402)-N(4))-methyltransferase RsmH [Clostridia bacterium]